MKAPVSRSWEDERRLLRRYLVAALVATSGWAATAVISTFLPPRDGGTNTDPPFTVIAIFGLAIAGTVEATTTARTAREARITLGDADAALQVRVRRFRRLFLVIGVAFLVGTLAMAVLSWIPPPEALSVVRPLFLGLLIAGSSLLATARGLNRGWLISPLQDSVEPTLERAANLSETIKSQRAEIRRNQAILRTSRQDVIDVYLAVREVEQQRKSQLSPNAIWAGVGFALGIVGNWIAQPLFDLLTGPLTP